MKSAVLCVLLFVGCTFAAIADKLPESILQTETKVNEDVLQPDGVVVVASDDKPISVPVIEEVEEVIQSIPAMEIEGVITNLKDVGFYPVYLKCLKETFDRFGTDFMAEVVFENDMITSVPLAYAAEYYCEDKGYSMIDEKTQLASGDLFRKKVQSSVSDEFAVAKNYYLGLADCYTACNNGEQPMPTVKLTVPKDGIPAGPKIDVDLMTKSFNLDTCAFRCYALGDPDRNVYLVDSLIYKYVNDDLNSEGDDETEEDTDSDDADDTEEPKDPEAQAVPK